MYDLLERGWNPVEVKTEIAVLLFPLGAVTAGVRLGANKDIVDLDKAVKA